MISRLDERVIFSSCWHPLKACSLMVMTLLGSVTSSVLRQFMKPCESMNCSLVKYFRSSRVVICVLLWNKLAAKLGTEAASL